MQIQLYHITCWEFQFDEKMRMELLHCTGYVTAFNVVDVGHSEICTWTGAHVPADPCLSVIWPAAPPCGD